MIKTLVYHNYCMILSYHMIFVLLLLVYSTSGYLCLLPLGGTNFGFMNGANEGGMLQPQPTSYDYDAPLSEAGDPTEKYFLIQKTLAKYVQIPAGPQPKASEKAAYGKVDTVEV